MFCSNVAVLAMHLNLGLLIPLVENPLSFVCSQNHAFTINCLKQKSFRTNRGSDEWAREIEIREFKMTIDAGLCLRLEIRNSRSLQYNDKS